MLWGGPHYLGVLWAWTVGRLRAPEKVENGRRGAGRCTDMGPVYIILKCSSAKGPTPVPHLSPTSSIFRPSHFPPLVSVSSSTKRG